ncbi:hypothetical protein Tco_0720139, partial [Tanacetum coccineum]
MLNNMGRVTGQREVRPIWNNAQRVNHQNKLTHPHPKRNFVPTAVLTKSGNVLVNTAKQSSSRAAVSNSTARYVNTAASRPTMNGAKTCSNVFHKSHSSVKRTIYQRTTPKNSDFKEKVNTTKGNPQYALQDQGIFDSGCSRHMTGNKSYLTDYQDIDGGFVAFAGSPKGGKITGKGKIRTGKLDFEDVYFVKELKFNLFSVSQMCDKKNSVLFTETECLVLSPDFKLLDESQVLLKVPRQNNMYSFDLKNVVPSGVNSVKQIHAIVDGKAVVITESSVRNDLLFDDEDGITCLTNDEIFENLTLMSSKSTGWNEFSNNLASAVICLAKGQNFNFSKLIFDGMLRNLDSKKFLMYPRQSKSFSGKVTPLFESMLVQNHAHEGEGSAIPPEPQPTPSTSQPNVSEPQTELLQTETSPIVSHEPQIEAHIDQILPSPSTFHRKHIKTQKHRRAKKVTKLPQTSVPLDLRADEAVHKEGVTMWKITTDASLVAAQDSDNIIRTQTMAMPNVDIPQGMDTGGSPMRQETIGGALAQTRSERVLEKPNEPPFPEGHTSGSKEGRMEHTFKLMDIVPPIPYDSPLTGGYTPGSDEGRLKLKELMAMCTKLSKQMLDLEKEKDAQAMEILKLNQRVKKLERKRKSSISYPERRIYRQVKSSNDDLDEEDASKQGRTSDKTKPMFKDSNFDDLDDLVDEGMAFVQEKYAENQGKIGVDDIKAVNTAGEGVSTAAPRTPPTTTTVFDDEDVTISMANTLIKMKEEKAKEKGVAIKDVEDFSRHIRSITTLQPLPTIDPKDKGEGVLVEEEPEKPEKVKRRDQGLAQIESDAELAQILHKEKLAELDRAQKEKQKQEEATNAALAKELLKFKPEWHKTLEELQKLYQKEQKWINNFKPMDSEEDCSNTKNAGKRIKRIAYSTKSYKEAAADYEQEKEELRMWLAVVLDEDETVDPGILSVKYLIVDWESWNLGSVDMEDIHVYKIIRADGNTSYHKTFSSMLRKFDRQDLMDLHRLVIKRFEDNTPEGYNLLLWGDLKVIVHSLLMDGTLTCFNMLVQKRYPLIKEMLKKMLNWKLEAEAESTMAFELLKFIKSQDGQPEHYYGRYIRLEEEKARKRGEVFNRKTAKYGKIWYDEDVHDLRSVETEFPAIVFNDNLTLNETLSCEPTVKNNNEKVNMPSFPSPKPKLSCIDDLDFIKDFKNEFSAIVYNDALTSKSDFSTEPTLCPQHIDEFDFKDETSLFEYDEEEQNVLYFNDLFPFNIIYPDDLKSDKDNDDNKIDIIQSSGGNVNTQGSNKLLEASHDKINKIFNVKSFIMELNVNIVVWNYLVNGMLLNLIKNLYVPFGILFDSKRYYKDGVCTRMLRRPSVFIQKINTAYSDPLNTAYRSSDTESESEILYLIFVLNFLSFFRANPADIFTWITCITVNEKYAYELNGKFLDDLHKNAFSGTNGEDAIEHIEYFLKIVDPIDLPNVNQDKLRVFVFLISLVGNAWKWFDEIKGSIDNPDVLTNDIVGFKTYDEYKDDCIYEWNKNVPWVHKKPWTDAGVWTESTPDSELKEEALKNKAIMAGMIEEDDESSYKGCKIWDGYEITNHDQEERYEVFNDHEWPVCNIRRFELIKYSFRQDEEYVAVKKDEYEDLTNTSEDACQSYQEIFLMMDEGWMDLAAKKIDEVGEVSTIWKSRSVGVLKLTDALCERQDKWKCVLTRLIDDLLALDSKVRFDISDRRLELTATFSIPTYSEKLESSSYQALGACFNPYKAFLR